MLDYEFHAREWILANVDTLNSLWNLREQTNFRTAFRNDDSVVITGGMTRIVIVGSDFVIKIDKPKDPRWTWAGNSRNEVRMYKKAVKDGYAWLFCRIRAMVIAHHTYYIMEKVDIIAEACGYSGIEDFSDYLSEDAFDYIQENVFDIHCGNFGFIDDEPVILDYAANYC